MPSFVDLYFPCYCLTFSPLDKLPSAIFLVCFNFQSASISPKAGENVVGVSNSLDLGETPSNSATHPDPYYLHYETLLMNSGLRANRYKVPLPWRSSVSYTKNTHIISFYLDIYCRFCNNPFLCHWLLRLFLKNKFGF